LRPEYWPGFVQADHCLNPSMQFPVMWRQSPTLREKPPSQTWKTFLKNHAIDITAVDFFTVPTATFRILYCFITIRHHRRKIAHFNVTYNPSAKWTSQQITEAFPYDSAPKYLIRDRDKIYGDFFVQRVNRMGIKEIKIAPQSPWQNPYAERVIGSIRRECLNHFIIFNENHFGFRGWNLELKLSGIFKKLGLIRFVLFEPEGGYILINLCGK